MNNLTTTSTLEDVLDIFRDDYRNGADIEIIYNSDIDMIAYIIGFSELIVFGLENGYLEDNDDRNLIGGWLVTEYITGTLENEEDRED